MIPLYVFISKLKAIDTYFGILAPNLASATGVFLITQGIKTVPYGLIDSARIDGAGEMRIVLQIVAPCVKTTLVTATLILFLGSWNGFLWPMIVINSEHLRTIPVALAFFRDPGRYIDVGIGFIMAATLLSLIPIMIIYIFTQKYMIKGMALSGIKF
jgi:ABC-type glycerol-3-phosphate transport system permease component